MRLLHRRHDHARASFAGPQPVALRGGDPRAYGAQPLPMRHAYADPARDPSRQRDIPPQTACAGGQPMSAERLSRRAVLAGAGALVVGFSLLPRDLLAQAPGGPKPPGSLEKSPMLDAWIRIDPDGKITIFTGKAELGQGIKTALVQLAAEELVVMPEAIHLVTADTAL